MHTRYLMHACGFAVASDFAVATTLTVNANTFAGRIGTTPSTTAAATLLAIRSLASAITGGVFATGAFGVQALGGWQANGTTRCGRRRIRRRRSRGRGRHGWRARRLTWRSGIGWRDAV